MDRKDKYTMARHGQLLDIAAALRKEARAWHQKYINGSEIEVGNAFIRIANVIDPPASRIKKTKTKKTIS